MVTFLFLRSFTILNISNPLFGRILLLLTIKARSKFRTLETALELYFCQNKSESKLNERLFYWI